MNRWTRNRFSFGIFTVLLLTACQPKPQTLLPVTGVEEISLPASAQLARDNVLAYVLSSARLASLPPGTDWQWETGEQREGEYSFRSGDWLMLIRHAESAQGSLRIILLNKAENVSWTGYVTADGRVVDTAYDR